MELLSRDVDRDGFIFAVGRALPMAEDRGGHATWRVRVDVELAGRTVGSVKLDVSPRPHELDATDTVSLPNSLAFAGLGTVEIEIIEIHRHAAEKLHAMLRSRGEGENSRVRDLVDLMLMREHGLLATSRLADVVTRVWDEREAAKPPVAFPELPASWPGPYARLAGEHGVEPSSFPVAGARAAELWAAMFAAEKT